MPAASYPMYTIERFLNIQAATTPSFSPMADT
jgi:hypothetical protein